MLPLEEVRHQGRALTISNIATLPVHAFCFVLDVDEMISWLPALTACCCCSAAVMDSTTRTASQNSELAFGNDVVTHKQKSN